MTDTNFQQLPVRHLVRPREALPIRLLGRYREQRLRMRQATLLAKEEEPESQGPSLYRRMDLLLQLPRARELRRGEG